jgi:nucleoside-diphosphate-sugar epimerase
VRILVTGATGFIGSHFVNHALAAGHEVIALRRSTESRPRIELVQSPRWLTKSMLDVSEHDFAGVDCLVHLAATGISPRTAPWDELLLWNVTAPMQLMTAAHDAGVDRWVITGTFAEYGNSGLRYEFIPPDAPLEPTYPYAASKAAGSILFQALAAERHARLNYLRLFSVFGDGQHESNLWPILSRAAESGEDVPMTPGEQVRDFVSVDRVAAAILAACSDESLQPGVPRVCNIGSGEPQAVRQFAEHWWRRWNARSALKFGALPYRAGEVMRYVPALDRTAAA